MARLRLILLTLIALWMPWTVQAELVIQITQGQENALPIAVVPFTWDGPGRAPTDVAEVIAADLYRSGQFKPLARGAMLSFPSQQDQVFFRDWRMAGEQRKGVNYLLIGRWRQSAQNNRYEVEFELYDVFAGRQIKVGDASGSQPRAIAHYISDIVYETITGIKGAFSTRLAYVTLERLADGEQRFRLHRADSDGFNSQVIVESDEPILSPSWAPNGRDIAFVSFHGQRKPAIFIVNTQTGESTRITSYPGLNGAPVFSPDGRRLAMVLSKDGNPEIYVYEFAKGRLERLTNHYAIDTEPTWHPDGQKIAFTSDRGGSPQIYEIELSSRKLRRLTFEGSYNSRATYSPDGRELIMVHRNQGAFHIGIQHLARGTFRTLTETQQDESPSVAPNGVMVIYATQEAGRGVLAAVSMDGRVKVKLPSSEGHVREPAWSPFLY